MRGNGCIHPVRPVSGALRPVTVLVQPKARTFRLPGVVIAFSGSLPSSSLLCNVWKTTLHHRSFVQERIDLNSSNARHFRTSIGDCRVASFFHRRAFLDLRGDAFIFAAAMFVYSVLHRTDRNNKHNGFGNRCNLSKGKNGQPSVESRMATDACAQKTTGGPERGKQNRRPGTAYATGRYPIFQPTHPDAEAAFGIDRPAICIFHFQMIVIPELKDYLLGRGVNVRRSERQPGRGGFWEHVFRRRAAQRKLAGQPVVTA